MDVEPIIRGVDAHKVDNSGAVKVHALRGVNLAIRGGEMVAIMGPSGCGKPTWLNCFSGLDDLTSGDVLIEGVSLAPRDDNGKSRYRSRRMGFVFQKYNLLPVLTAVENVEVPLLGARVPGKEARRKALALMTAVELDGWADHKPAQLSAGQQQRVAIARALVNDPAIVWADEPTGNLDSETSAQIMDLLVRLNREQGQTLVLVTHDAVVSARAHRILRMRNGEIVEETRGGEDGPPRGVGMGDRQRGGPRGERDPDRRNRAGPPEGHAGPQRRGEQGKPADHGDGPQRLARRRLRTADPGRRPNGRHGPAAAGGALRERTRGGGPERDRGPGSHAVLRHHEPDDRPRHGRRDRAGCGQGRVREPRDPVHGPSPGPGRVQ